MNALLVTSANHVFFDLVIEAIASVRDLGSLGGLEIAILDIGLHDWQVAALSSEVQHIVKPGWAIDFPGQATASPVLRSQIARPFLPDLFPGYEMFLWMDADVWIQDALALPLYCEAAAGGDLAITPEIHRYYASLYQDPRKVRPCEYQIYSLGWGTDAADQMIQSPLVNTGMFALRRDSKVWSNWGQTLAMLLSRTTDFYTEQTALNGAILSGHVSFVPLPAYCNWLCHHAIPVFDPTTGDWLEPGFPRQKIAVIHMTGPTKFQSMDVQTTDRRTFRRSLRYMRPTVPQVAE